MYSGRSSGWSKKQRRVFQRLVSWCYEAKSRDCQLSRVDLTTGVGGPAHLLRRHLQELRRRVERDLGYKGIETFVAETSEGNGVLHMVWAWAGSREFIIDQRWLSEVWAKIHGAPIVFIRRMNLAKDSIRRVGRYFALQYLADQRGALVRMSWSWRRARFAIGKGWKFMCRALWQINRERQARDWRDQPDLPFSDLLIASENLLTRGWCVLGSSIFVSQDRQVMELFGNQNG
jgi:hypothetical protein